MRKETATSALGGNFVQVSVETHQSWSFFGDGYTLRFLGNLPVGVF